MSNHLSEYDKGDRAYNNMQFSQALLHFKQSSINGNANAQYRLAYMYCYGIGVAQDLHICAKYSQDAAINGFSDYEELSFLWEHFDIWDY